jgi:Alpha amylase, catalytic domain
MISLPVQARQRHDPPQSSPATPHLRAVADEMPAGKLFSSARQPLRLYPIILMHPAKIFLRSKSGNGTRTRSSWFSLLLAMVLLASLRPDAKGEAMLQLFNVNWDELIRKMPEIAEAGYTSLWLPPPAKAGSVFSVGYDLFDPFDLGDKNQRGTVRTRYGTKAELLQVVETAHRFGLRVYFDNIMNHRGFDVPGYSAGTPTNIYPGLTVEDFHLRRQNDGTYRNWDSINDYGNLFEVQNRPLFGLIDLANEAGANNNNFGLVQGNTTPKVSFIRQPGNPEYYMDLAQPFIAAPWRPFNGTNGDPVIEDVNGYLIRAALWTMAETRCDGFRFDAVKHTPATFFGDAGSATANGYVGGIQTLFDYIHGYGNNVTSNGYVESDDNRNSCFDSETARNDALLFGEHLGEPPSYQEYIDRGMRLLGVPLHFHLNNVFGNPSASLGGLEQRDPSVAPFSPIQSVMFAQSHDDGVATRRELHNAYNFLHEGIPVIYSDGYNQSSAPDYFPRVANAPYLGQFGDRKMPDLVYLHHQLARGGTRPRWGDADIVAFERYDYRDPGSAADQTVVLFAMNDNYGFPGDVAFVDGEGESFPAGVNDPPGVGANGHQGIVVGFPPGSVLVQLATATPGYDRTYQRVTVRPATNNRAAAINGTVYVGSQAIPPGGGAIEILIPSGGYVAYGYQWPEASRAGRQDAITLRQNGSEAARMTVYRTDGVNGDSGFSPDYPFRMRGSINADGSVIGGVSVSNKTYAIDIPVVTNANYDILVRCDASAVNTLLKLDGGVDLNSHLSLGPTNGFDKRDQPPGSSTDLLLGYEQTQFNLRHGPEKFAARLVERNNVTSAGAETYYYTAGLTNLVTINGSSNAAGIYTSTATWVYHDPAAPNTANGLGTATQRMPLNPTNGEAVELWVKVGYQFQIDACHIYFTTDGSNPEGAFGVGQGTTKVVEAFWVTNDVADGTIDWWKGTIPDSNQIAGVQVRYKIALYKGKYGSIGEISDADDSRRYGLYSAGITNFNPTTPIIWRHANRNTNDTLTGLQEGFHILRARTFLPRTNKSSVFNTFAQTFYYDAAPPAGVIAFPSTNGTSLSGISYELVIRTDNSATAVEVNIADSNSSNDDTVTGLDNGNGLSNGVPVFATAAPATPSASLNTAYPGLPKEYRFNYVGIPSSGTATITVRISEATSTLFSNRVQTLVRTVNTVAPARVLYISAPATNGPVHLAGTNSPLTIRVCNTTQNPETATLANYTLKIDGVTQTNSDFVFGTSILCGNGYNSLSYRWANIPAGPHVIEAIFTGSVVLTDTRTINVIYPPAPGQDSDNDGMSDINEGVAGTDPNDSTSLLRITELANGNQLVVWDSVAGKNYQVLATTNLTAPLMIISPVIQASSSSSFYFDSTPDATNKFYRIQLVP